MDSYDDKYYDDETKSLHYCIYFFMQTLTSPAFSPYNGFEPVAFAHGKHWTVSNSVRYMYRYKPLIGFFYMESQFSS